MTMIASTALILLTVVNLVTLAGAVFAHAIATPSRASRSWLPLVVVNAAVSLLLLAAVFLGHLHVPGQKSAEITVVGYLVSIWFISAVPITAAFLDDQNLDSGHEWSESLAAIVAVLSVATIVGSAATAIRLGITPPFDTLPLPRKATYVYTQYLFHGIALLLAVPMMRERPPAPLAKHAATGAFALFVAGKIAMKLQYPDYFEDNDLGYVLTVVQGLVIYMLLAIAMGVSGAPALPPRARRGLSLSMCLLVLIPAALPLLYGLLLDSSLFTDPAKSAVATAVIGAVAGVVATEAWNAMFRAR